jgi:hypothetical protein
VEEAREDGEEALEEIDGSEPEREVRYITSIFMRKDDSGLEDEFEYLWDTQALSSQGEPEEDRWWSPEPPQPSSEEDKEEVRYLTQALGPETREGEAGQEADPAPERVRAHSEEDTMTPETPQERRSPQRRSARRKRPRKKVARTKDQEWEQVRQDAWLREMLTDTSESENEEKCRRFVESGRWLTELFGIPQQRATTSRGECSGQKTPDSS